MSVAQFQSQGKPFMPLTPKQQNQRAIESDAILVLAELALQRQKGTRSIKLADLRSDAERAIFIAAALEAAPILFSPEAECDRALRLNALRGETHAIAEKDAEDAAWQARQDVVKFGTGAVLAHGNFGMVRAGYCHICKGRISPLDAFVLELSASLKADVHGSCCLKDEAKYEMLSSFSFRMRDGAK